MARAATKGAFNYGITVSPSPALLAKAFGLAAEDFSDWRAAWQMLAPALAQGLRSNIESRGGAISESWPGPDPAYVRRKARQGFGRADLVYLGIMVRQVTSATGGILALTKRSIRFGTRVTQARAVNFGSSKRGIRARRFMGWNPQMTAAADAAATALAKTNLAKLAERLRGKEVAGGR